jgi:hypothetical protein
VLTLRWRMPALIRGAFTTWIPPIPRQYAYTFALDGERCLPLNDIARATIGYSIPGASH